MPTRMARPAVGGENLLWGVRRPAVPLFPFILSAWKLTPSKWWPFEEMLHGYGEILVFMGTISDIIFLHLVVIAQDGKVEIYFY